MLGSKERYSFDKSGRLVIDRSKIKSNERFMIYLVNNKKIILEKNINPSNSIFDGKYYLKYHDKYMAKDYAKSLLSCLEMAEIDNVDLISNGFGGLVAAYASKSELVNSAIAIHSPILGSPLFNPEEIEINDNLFKLCEKALIIILKKLSRAKHLFYEDIYNGIDFSEVDLDKIIVIGSIIDPSLETNRLILCLYKIMLKFYGDSDGIVLFDEKELITYRLNYMFDRHSTNYYDSTKNSYIDSTINRVLQKKFNE